MPESHDQYVLELYGDNGDALGRTPVEMDWLPAIEYAHFSAIRAGTLPAVTVAPPSRVEPIWDSDSGKPYISGVRIVLEVTGGCLSAVVPTEYFNAVAREASAEYVADGRLKTGQTFRYRVTVFAADARGDPAPAEPGPEMEAVEQALCILNTPLAGFLDKAFPVGDDDPDDVPVFVRHQIIEEAQGLVRQADDVETGGVLLGRLHRDTDRSHSIFVELTAQIPAAHTRREATRLTFTPDTWAAAQAALDLRNAGESILGWWHSHPNWCRNCDPARQKVCPLGGIFFSSDDLSVQRTVFPRASHLGLLLSDRRGGIIPALFGWKRGTVASRAFHLLGSPDLAPARDLQSTATIGGPERAHDQEPARRF